MVSALWSVSDEETTEMMGHLYEAGDVPVYDRVRDLQLEKIKRLRSRHESDHPFSWGAFVVVGDPMGMMGAAKKAGAMRN